jgi:hypothetical protein
MSYLATLKKNKEKNLEKLVAALNPNNGFRDEDKDFWKPTPDKAGNAYAIIRFLPPPEGEDLPIVNYWSHAFQVEDTSKWYIERSRTSLGDSERDPVAEWNKQLWNAGLQDQAKKQKRKIQYVANIYVVKDTGNPEAEGRVWKYKFGPAIKDFINLQASPQFPGEKPVDVFDLFEGATFVLKQRKKDGFPSYDLSSFEKPSAFMDGDEEALEGILKQLFSLQAELAADKFKSYEYLLKRLNKARGITDEEPTLPAAAAKPAAQATKPAAKKAAPKVADEDTVPWDTDEPETASVGASDEEMSFFNSLVDKN